MTLCIPRLVPPDGNPFNDDRIQVSGGSRTTEDDAARHVPDAPPPVPMMNGQVVDTDEELMCSKCGEWKPDDRFSQWVHGVARRGRRYYCKDCLSVSPYSQTTTPSPTKKKKKGKKRK